MKFFVQSGFGALTLTKLKRKVTNVVLLIAGIFTILMEVQ
jgi:hypothetical protein